MGDCRVGSRAGVQFPRLSPGCFWRLKVLSWCRRDGAEVQRANAYVILRSRYSTRRGVSWTEVAPATVEVAGLTFRSFKGRRRSLFIGDYAPWSVASARGR